MRAWATSRRSIIPSISCAKDYFTQLQVVTKPGQGEQTAKDQMAQLWAQRLNIQMEATSIEETLWPQAPTIVSPMCTKKDTRTV